MLNSTSSSSPQPILAQEMAQAIKLIAHKLKIQNVLDQANYSTLMDVARKVTGRGATSSWGLMIDRQRPLIFGKFVAKDKKVYTPQIVCPGIDVDQSKGTGIHFTRFDIALEILDSKNTPVARWHVDMANITSGKRQEGPTFHLQYGGQCSNGKGQLHPLQEPRWCHPPLDLLLLCEVVAANFYPQKWESLREERNWCTAIATGEKLCYSFYLSKFNTWLNNSNKTCLHAMWASEWT